MNRATFGCSSHPDAPHGFDRTASHNAGRYVCTCEGWEPAELPAHVATPRVPDGWRLAKELDGVIADIEEGDGFDAVFLATVKRVRDALAAAPKQGEQK